MQRDFMNQSRWLQFRHWNHRATQRLRDQGTMNLSDDEKPKGARIIDWQLKRPEYGEALRSYHKPLAEDERFRELLRRLEEAERDQSK
ncbi:hypothetical protein J2X72_005162 [Phyllobacterium sp. 1468]|uniref:hypothetical protein n=1 Tax=Phyllobacterium sp. 1468 TaxID=2817759 RepID=UPI002863DCEF|nr:hypothetical protein [Phyllobacterium sp. 1468]MDR6636346.1 hypothetical protein [Phyllobacterium sp. 1468]